MVVPDLVFSLIVALVISVIFARILVRGGPRRGFFWFYLVIFLAVYAGGIWAKPYGAPLSALNWLPFLVAGIVMAFLLTILAPRYPKVKREAQFDRQQTLYILDEIDREKKIADLAYISINFLFWGVVALLVFIIISRYVL